MRFFEKVPTKVEGMVQGSAEYVLIEIKSLFSIILTHLAPNGVTAKHSHAFNAITIWLKGTAYEVVYPALGKIKVYGRPMFIGKVKYTRRADFHYIRSGFNGSWFLTFRGPWSDTWQEERNGKMVTLTHGRKEL